ncbi:hypothetical protein HPP92_014229 [Vanilla planifolia]|uniref:DUF6821 domain-containing protein n=1 Tax=Vanilla planifolia TaxID=51239 RepID=A0A835QT52_VANPL|nr:hypothetical protein HPP92_014229 [Vanilla planifolia]
MEKTLHDPLELDMEEWEYLPDNTFLDLGLKEVKNSLSKEIIFANYFREEPELIPKAELSEERISNVFHELESTDIVASSPETGTVVILEPQQDSTGKEEGKLQGQEEEEGKEKPIWEGFSIAICRGSVAAIGALCSVGVATAATVCFLLLGGQRHKQLPRRHHHDTNVFRFGLQSDGKRLTQVAEQAGRLNQALAAARGVPSMTRSAHISFGGYYDGF